MSKNDYDNDYYYDDEYYDEEENDYYNSKYDAYDDVVAPSGNKNKSSSSKKGAVPSIKCGQRTEIKGPQQPAATTALKAAKTAPKDAKGIAKSFGNTPQTTIAISSPAYKESPAVADATGKQSITVIITGHVDSGKSTIIGHLLLELGKFTDNDVRRNAAIGATMRKESFKFAWLLDQSEEERRRGVTIDSGSHSFATNTKYVNLLDAPGHRDFIMNMISSATQADAALLIISAQKGEFESGLHNGTEEHLIVLKVLGVTSVVVVINKMDLTGYSEERYMDVIAQLQPVIKAAGYDPSEVRTYVPVSGLLGINLSQLNVNMMPWYKGSCLKDVIDSISLNNRYVDAPLRISVQDMQRNTIYGRVESGTVKKGAQVKFMPSKRQITVRGLSLQAGGLLDEATAGALVEITSPDDLAGICSGEVGCPPKDLITCSTDFEARIDVFGGDRLKRSIIPGSTFTMGLQSIIIGVTVERLIAKYTTDGKPTRGMLKSIPAGAQGVVVFRAERIIPLERAEVLRSLGRFILRQDDETVAGGIVTAALPVSE